MAKQPIKDLDLQVRASDDVLEFRSAVRDVKPLAHALRATSAVKPGPRPRRNPPAVHENLEELMPLVDSSADGHGAAGAALSFQRSGVQSHVLRRLRRGSFPVEDELDLHGLTQTVARDQLARFIRFNRDAGHRCVRIIHGKGYRSGARGPVLKIAVDFWLRRHFDVMAFTSARPIDGGTGALYVLLRA